MESVTNQFTFQTIRKDLFQTNVWLLIYPYSNGSLSAIEHFVKATNLQRQENIRFDSQIYVLTLNGAFGDLYEVYSICKQVPLSINHLIISFNSS